MTREETKEFLERMQIISDNIAEIVHGDKEKDLAWQLGQMLTTCENWLDRLTQGDSCRPYGPDVAERAWEQSHTFPHRDSLPNSQLNVHQAKQDVKSI